MNSDHIQIVLVEPQHPGNIGAVARAMKTMGLSRLTLVAPEKFPHEEARWRAVSAADVLENARVVETIEEAIADCQFVVGTSDRTRRIPWPIQDVRTAAGRLATLSEREQVAILFGREDCGLETRELEYCNLHLHIPAHEQYTSLNLAMAVQVVTYELRMAGLVGQLPPEEDAEWDAPFASSDEMARFYAHLEAVLIEIDFLKPEAPRQLMRRLRRLYNRVRLDTMEVNILRGILTETQKTIARGGPRDKNS